MISYTGSESPYLIVIENISKAQSCNIGRVNYKIPAGHSFKQLAFLPGIENNHNQIFFVNLQTVIFSISVGKPILTKFAVYEN